MLTSNPKGATDYIDADLNDINDAHVLTEHFGMLRERGHIGFLGHGPETVEFRNIYIKDLGQPEKDNTAPKGFTALFCMLTSCASGITVCNIDNGFGAAFAAARILRTRSR